ncbi:MAG: right-handed parallel beta-helix repeat-containing protein, partial [Salinivirgaceae bacterium]
MGASGAITPIIDPLIVGGTYASTRYTNFYLQPSYNSSLTTGTYKTYGQTKVIIYYGTLEVGKTGNTTTLDISDKGFLNIVSPGVLKILANSEVIIRSGAKISMQPGGQIIIEGNGKLTIESGAIVNLNGGTIDLQSTQSVFNLSQNLTINSSGNTIEFKGVGSLTVKSGVTLSVASNTTLKTVCPVTVITGGTLSILTGGKLLLSGNTVTLNSTGVLNVAGSLILNTATSNTITGAGKMVYSGAITFNTGSTLTFQSNLWLADTKNLTLSVGKMKFGSGYSIKDASGDSWSGDIALSSNCELEIPTGISLTLGTGNDINLSTNGKLTVNGTLNLNGGILINDATSIFVLNGSVNVTSPSSINLGSITTYNGIVYATSDGNLIVESGKTIDLTSGKTINISNSGILTINGSLNMNGGTFSKNGTSKLYLNGVLNFSPYYKFTIDCYTELNGTINVPANFSLTFSGSNKSTVLLNVKKSFVFDADLANLTIQNGKIIMDNSTSELYFNNGIDNINLNNIWVTSATGITNNSHQGIDIRSDENITITNSIFEMGNYGVYSSRSATAQNLNITNSTFKSCDYGLRVYNSGVTIDGSTFESNTAMGIYCTSMDKSSSISNSTIRYQSDTGDYGVYYEGASTAVLNFDSNIITNNYNGVCLVGSFNTVFKCNFITTNSNYGVNTQNNGAIYLANAAGITGGNNDMHSNKIALSGSGTTQYFNSFYLNNGYNDLRDNGV